jgi:prevent-host-death family protein
MTEVSVRDLRNHGGEVLDRASRGERVVITRSGKPVAELHALSPQPLSAEVLLSRWRALPAVDPLSMRVDIDAILDAQV